MSESGFDKIKFYTDSLETSPGVYRMLDEAGAVLYVGKAKNLKKRVLSYTKSKGHTSRIIRMIMATDSMIFLTTETELEALLLEQNLIKQLKPKYNVLLRDDKSFPDIFISQNHDFPQISKHRGKRKADGAYYGPFASVPAVNRTLNYLQRVFLLRNCTDSVFESRTRPCLLFQIKRCSGPCVGKISKESYAQLVEDASDFLSGKKKKVNKELVAQMTSASERMEFELAATLRDRLKALAQIQLNQAVNPITVEEADVIALSLEGSQACIQVFFYRSNQNWGNRAFFPKTGEGANGSEILEGFIMQFYRNRIPPSLIILSQNVENEKLIQSGLSAIAGKSVKVAVPERGEKRVLSENALRNANQELLRKVNEQQKQHALLKALGAAFDLSVVPKRIEVYDNSHIQGAYAVGVMIVAGSDGFLKSQYRKFNIKDEKISAGDDLGMMNHMLRRRFSNLKKLEQNDQCESRPDLIIIDGGIGQLREAMKVLKDFGISDIDIIGIAKGPDRNAGNERFFLPNKKPFSLPNKDATLFFIQRLRDEAHRFAIGTHRKKRAKTIEFNRLDQIEGVGASRRRALLTHFGSAKAVSKAGIMDLRNVRGISYSMAEKIYFFFKE